MFAMVTFGFTLVSCIGFWVCGIQLIYAELLLKPASSPVIQDKPFVVVWNMPTARCQWNYGIDLPLGVFDIIKNKGDHFKGQNMTIFYKNKFGLYPYITKDDEIVYKGVPQRVNMRDHLKIVTRDVKSLLFEDFSGLAVIDWEEWRPLWAQNWGLKRIYKEFSKYLVRTRQPYLTDREATRVAKKEFEIGAQNFLRKTLKTVRRLRFSGLWGMYGFPECFNSNWRKVRRYTGHCHKEDIQRNNQLAWLWKASSALYPSVYLHKNLSSTEEAWKFVHYRVKEALRAAAFGSPSALPVLPYSRVAYMHSPKYLSEIDLVHTIGESAAMGTAGVVLWSDLSFAKSVRRCESLQNYIWNVLGTYVLNVTTSMQLCSQRLCGGNGRCVRKEVDTPSYLHLNPESFRITRVVTGTQGEQELSVVGELLETDFKKMNEAFMCHCYRGWHGAHCLKNSVHS
ncbi:hyaluronidase-like [Protopterus annectens]|uniref:hyaluronidase-like n=1 Tax=Protopterus annectens TaxID=7888 RepID=UPI001CF9CD83|nr:hyaluronidase-like [Protopterus annectens]